MEGRKFSTNLHDEHAIYIDCAICTCKQSGQQSYPPQPRATLTFADEDIEGKIQQTVGKDDSEYKAQAGHDGRDKARIEEICDNTLYHRICPGKTRA